MTEPLLLPTRKSRIYREHCLATFTRFANWQPATERLISLTGCQVEYPHKTGSIGKKAKKLLFIMSELKFYSKNFSTIFKDHG